MKENFEQRLQRIIKNRKLINQVLDKERKDTTIKTTTNEVTSYATNTGS